MTVTLTEFLLARIAEDQAVATLIQSAPPKWTMTVYPHDGEKIPVAAGPFDPARVLAECAVKRSVLELLIADSGDSRNAVRRGWAVEIFHQYAAVYADHPDFDPAWRV